MDAQTFGRGDRVKIVRSLLPFYNGETGTVIETWRARYKDNGEPVTVAHVRFDRIGLSAEWTFDELAKL